MSEQGKPDHPHGAPPGQTTDPGSQKPGQEPVSPQPGQPRPDQDLPPTQPQPKR